MKNTKLIIAAVLSLIFASCEKDNILENKEVSGKDVPVRIRSMSVAESGSENLGRSSSQREPKTVTSPVRDGMLLEMSIKEDETPLRDKTELTSGAFFRIIAVEAGTTKYYSHGDYEYGDPSILLTDFHVKVGKEYDYICFSFNETTNTLPSSSSYSVGDALPSLSLTIDPTSDDPLWCKITGLGVVTAAGVDLDILLKRRLAKVKIKLDCGYNKWKITGVADDQVSILVNDPDYDCTMDWKTGILSGTDLDQGLTYSISDFTRTDQTSNEVTIIPKGSNAVIKIGTSTVSRDALAAIPSAERSATLTQALEGGVSYTITVRLRTPIWARSNVYWDNDAKTLTFVRAKDNPAENDNTKQGYQGLFFKWGSLVGISPARVQGQQEQYQIIFSGVPCYRAGGTGAYYYTWSNIPHWDSYSVGNIDVGEPDVVALRGDVCKYIDSDYRLPVDGEFGTTDGWDQQGWEKGGSYAPQYTANTTTNTYGMYDTVSNSWFHAKNTAMDVIFPASGQRVYSNGTLSRSAFGYWSSSIHIDVNAYGLYFTTGVMTPRSYTYRNDTFPIRCVKN